MGPPVCTLLLLAVALDSAPAPDRCAVLSELDAKRTGLSQQYEAQWKRDRGRDPALNTLLHAIRSLAAQERDIIFAVLREAEAGEHEKVRDGCCQGPSNPSVLRWLCVMATYLRDRDAARLVKTMPVDRTGITSLWEMDTIVGVETAGPPSVPAPASLESANLSFATYIIDRVYELVLQNDDLALRRFISLTLHADGYIAEGLEERLAQLIIQHPDIVLSRWRTIKKFAKQLHVGTTDFASSLDETVRKYRAACKSMSTSASDCRDVLAFLKRLASE